MTIYPAIDLAHGKAVRLLQGRRNDETVYNPDPASQALEWEKQGARYLHLVDLDGAFEGSTKNREAVLQILQSVKIPVQLGGGMRSLEDIAANLEMGVARVILGTLAIENPSLVVEAIQRFGADRIVIGIDARKSKVAVRGWTSESEQTPAQLAGAMKKRGAILFVYTDISRDGMLTGPNLGALEAFARIAEQGVIASGGIGTLEDVSRIAQYEKSGVEGMIIGKALYENRFTLQQALHHS